MTVCIQNMSGNLFGSAPVKHRVPLVDKEPATDFTDYRGLGFEICANLRNPRQRI
jgi:hypothetical protein